MLLYEYKLQATAVQQAALDEAIRVTQFIGNTCLRLWMDERDIGATDLQTTCGRLAHEFACAAALTAQARQAVAARAWAAISRFYANCREKRPGKKGSPRFQHDCRSVEYKITGWQLDSDGRRLTVTDGCGIRRLRLVGARAIATCSLEQIKRIRLARWADGYSAQVVLNAERRVAHVPTGRVVGVDVGLQVYLMDSEGQAVANPRCIHHVEHRVRRRHQRLSRRSLHHKQGKKPQHHHAARQRAKHNTYPPAPQTPTTQAPAPRAPTPLPPLPPLSRLQPAYHPHPHPRQPVPTPPAPASQPSPHRPGQPHDHANRPTGTGPGRP